MIKLEQFSISPHLTFDALVAGEVGAPLVLFLHGFAESMHCWDAQTEALGDAGYRAIPWDSLYAFDMRRGSLREGWEIAYGTPSHSD